MPDTIDFVLAVAGAAIGTFTPVGWAITVGGLAKMGMDEYTERQAKEVQQMNNLALTYVPGRLHDACVFVNKRGGMAFEAGPGYPWMWRENPNFSPVIWYSRVRATTHWPDGTWKFAFEYHPSVREKVMKEVFDRINGRAPYYSWYKREE